MTSWYNVGVACMNDKTDCHVKECDHHCPSTYIVKLLWAAILSTPQFLAHGTEVHWALDDRVVVGNKSFVNRAIKIQGVPAKVGEDCLYNLLTTLNKLVRLPRVAREPRGGGHCLGCVGVCPGVQHVHANLRGRCLLVPQSEHALGQGRPVAWLLVGSLEAYGIIAHTMPKSAFLLASKAMRASFSTHESPLARHSSL